MLNHIVVMGRLTHDPELRKTASGVSVASSVSYTHLTLPTTPYV